MHARPIDLVVFQEPMQHLLRETSSRSDPGPRTLPSERLLNPDG